MITIATPKSQFTNVIEGFALTVVLQAVPIYAAASLMLKLLRSDLVTPSRGLSTFVAAILIYALLVPLLGRRFPRSFKNAYEPLFFDATLPIADKIAGWRAKPHVSLQLVASTIMLSMLAVAVVSVG